MTLHARWLVAAVALLALVGCGSGDSLTAPEPSPSATEQNPDGTTPAPEGGVSKKPGQQVVPHHCGIQPVMHDGRKWEVTRPPFDMGNAPDTFSGFGEFRRDGDSLVFEDREGVRLTFTLDDGVEPPCA
jgi:hypothetical protein